jgi:lipopolysaccharide/colanic/teichoic acid biosynthesis glycosyltransferase
MLKSPLVDLPTPSSSVASAVLPSSPSVPHALPLRNGRLVQSVMVDRILAILLLVPALPVMAIAWSLVRVTSRGPGIYFQSRSGLNGKPFKIFKLRTMTHNCEAATGAVWAKPNDSRVTWLGKILRKTHLDELPQLFNVLRGEMSLVGPRPERPEIVERLKLEIPNYAMRMEVYPGVTGLAQIYAEPDQTLDDVRHKLALDLRYIAQRSTWLDLRIIGCTALKMVGLNRSWTRRILFPTMHRQTRRIDGPMQFPGQPWATL